ncbi:alpha/beta hydrolase [Bacillus cereus]|uniref:Alpha/beta hydrolase n=2 Tax=Bacillus cereus TaxID=1396 RepID=A0A2B1KT69_BACCE|nr:alpha/beta hydrolase [Bacillus cereus]
MEMIFSTIVRNTLGAIGFPFTMWNLALDRKNKVEPPGQIIKTSFSEIHAIVTGEGPITVILEAGFSSISIDWCYIQPEISKVARVISFDRGNYGWSRTKRKKMTSLDSVEEIKEVLNKLKIEPPYILVGHSFGGLSMRLFASMYPNDVVGLVLEDAAHENQYQYNEENKKRIKKFRRLVTFGYITSLIGLPRMLKQKIGRKFLAKKYDDSLRYIGYTLGAYKSVYREHLDTEISAKQLVNAKPLHQDLNVIVISAKNESENWNENQQLLTKLTHKTEYIQTDTGHSVHLEKPEIVIDSIIKLINLNNFN